MPDAPFFEFPLLPEMEEEREKERALEQVRDRARTLMTFASTRGLRLPPDAEQRLTQLDASTLGELIQRAFTAPEAAAQSLLNAVNPNGH
jgi:hypothetical protein